MHDKILLSIHNLISNAEAHCQIARPSKWAWPRHDISHVHPRPCINERHILPSLPTLLSKQLMYQYVEVSGFMGQYSLVEKL